MYAYFVGKSLVTPFVSAFERFFPCVGQEVAPQMGGTKKSLVAPFCVAFIGALYFLIIENRIPSR